MKLILVIGPPRSGTSFVARVLHEKLGVCMGHNLVPGNAGNPLGFYEDFKTVTAVKKKDHIEIYNAIIKSHFPYGCAVVGAKTPEFAFYNDLWALIPDLIIRTIRNPFDNASSLIKWHRPILTNEEAIDLISKYEQGINRVLDHPVIKVRSIITINTSHHISDDELVSILKPKIGRIDEDT